MIIIIIIIIIIMIMIMIIDMIIIMNSNIMIMICGANYLQSRSSSPMPYGRFPKFHRVFSGRDLGTLKSGIVSKNFHN